MYPARDIQSYLYSISDPIDRFYQQFHYTAKFEHTPTSAAGSTALDCPLRAGLAVITINNDSDNIPSVQYQAFGADTPRSVENVECFHHIPDCSIDVRPDGYYIGCVKAVLKMQKSWDKVLAFLGGNSDTHGKMTEIILGDSAIVERLEIEGKNGEKVTHDKGKVMVNYTQFCETKCKIRSVVPNQPEPFATSTEVDTQFFNLRSSNLKAKDKIEDFSSVNILSGICLFSQEHLGYPHGEPAPASNDSETTPIEPSDHIVPLPLDQQPTLYEIESLVRLPNAIADIVSILPATIDVTITLDVPRAQYYAFLLDLYARGHCSKEHIKSWLEIIDRRHNQVAEVFERAVQDALQRRGVSSKNIRIELSTGLQEVIPYIQKTIDQDSAPSVGDLLRELLSLDPLFREYYEHLPQPQNPPNNLVDLCFTSYSYQVLRPVFRRVRESRSSGSGAQKAPSVDRQLLINIDNAAEWRIYSQAEKMLKGYQRKYSSVINPLLLGMFPSELVFTAENTGRTSLYLRNAGQEIYDESERKTVCPSDIVEKVYGSGVTRRVIDWMRLEGMFDTSNMLAMLNEPSSGGSSSDRDGTNSPVTECYSSEESPRGSEQYFGGYELKEKLGALDPDH